MDNERLYVGNISWNSDEAALEAAFSAHGEVREVRIITDRDTGRSRGFGFVTMGSASAASAAVEAMNGASLDGRTLKVNVAESRPGNRR